ncbi:MAG: DUF3768 domain-containing protein [Terriglobia bacterium]
MSTCDRRQRIAELNDKFRRTFVGGMVVKSAAIAALPADVQATIMQKVMTFTEFCADNDPHGEHDFGSFRLAGHHVFWKIDNYDERMEWGSEDPADPRKTKRVLTVMLAEEY